jgi:hypothetical protein
MKKYRCTNGEIVEVENINKGDKYILVHYKGKVYRREIGVIGKTLFPIFTPSSKVSFSQKLSKTIYPPAVTL